MIRFDKENQIIAIDTKNTTYAMQILRDKYVLHRYFGKKTKDVPLYEERLLQFSPYDAEISRSFSLDAVASELSFFGSGDLRDTGIKIKNRYGNSVTKFIYKSFRTFKGRIPFGDMPYSRNGDETLEITYFDDVSNCRLKSYYTVYYDTDTIVRYVVFENAGKDTLLIENALACQLDFENADFEFVCLAGQYYHERNITAYPLHFGKQSIYSERGHSSANANPFAILKSPAADENSGECYAAEFVYSGDFELQAELMYDKRMRFMAGLNRHTISWNLRGGDSFTTPETILTFSAEGLNGVSRNLHDHLRANVINPKFVYAPRPVVINTWEAVHFNINEDVLLKYADAAAEIGIDMLVVDDGWFGKRNDDTSSLGDWYLNTEKFKNGLESFSEKIHNKGLKLGIWIEPEMINPKSELYSKHPDWALQCPNREKSLWRHQLVLDMSNDEAVTYVANSIIETLKDVKLEYIKWDFNRSLSEVGSLAFDEERQCEIKHRFVLGTYKMHKMLTEAFPDVIFEGCSGGGGRFDAGILFYCPQIWTSDDTDPIERLKIQQGTMTAYPLSAISAHVSNTLINDYEDRPDYDLRFKVALGGVLGYELDITSLSPEEKKEAEKQIRLYKKLSGLILHGDAFRLSGLSDNEYGFYVLSKDGTEYYFEYYNLSDAPVQRLFEIKLRDEKVIIDTSKAVKYSGNKTLYYMFSCSIA